MPVVSPHHDKIRASLAQLKELASDLEGWHFSQEKNGVKLYQKHIGDSPFVYVRGETLLEGHEYTPREVLSVATLPGCRKVWDEKFDTSEIIEMVDKHEALSWVKLRIPWPLTARDMCAVSLRDVSADECYVVMTSVEDERVPHKSGCVRANLFISGWKVQKVEEGIKLSYITQVDFAGSIPTSFVNSVNQQVPLCAGLVVKYIQERGFAPITWDCTAQFKSENFDSKTKEYSCNLDDMDGETGTAKWLISKQMYDEGVKLSVQGPQGVTGEVVDDEDGHKFVVVAGISGPTTVKISSA
ncbi:hypothetical protein BDB01DRAFT_780138 [Pilobolus umbonatus]|nr:hypothetical protein BDB01DRAFT_780138 [Pilobolus umbonatus]